MSDTDLAFQVSDVTLSRIILGYLRERGQYDAMVALQLSSGVAENDMGQELHFLQQLTFEGRWEDVLGYVSPLKRYLTRYEQIEFFILRQQFLEALSWQGVGGHPLYSLPWRADSRTEETILRENKEDMSKLVKLLEILEKKCSSRDFDSLCLCLTVENLAQHPEFANWSVSKGRIDCFQALFTLLSNLLPGNNQQVLAQGSLRHIVSSCLTLQALDLDNDVMLDSVAQLQEGRNSLPATLHDGRLQLAGVDLQGFHTPQVMVTETSSMNKPLESVFQGDVFNLARSIDRAAQLLEEKASLARDQEDRSWHQTRGWDPSLNFAYGKKEHKTSESERTQSDQKPLLDINLGEGRSSNSSISITSKPLVQVKAPVVWVVDPLNDGDAKPKPKPVLGQRGGSSKSLKDNNSKYEAGPSTIDNRVVLSPKATSGEKISNSQKSDSNVSGINSWAISPPKPKSSAVFVAQESSLMRKGQDEIVTLAKLKQEGKRKSIPSRSNVVNIPPTSSSDCKSDALVPVSHDDESVTVCSTIAESIVGCFAIVQQEPVAVEETRAIKDSPVPTVVVSLDCPVRAVSIVPSSNASRGRHIVAVGTNDRALRLISIKTSQQNGYEGSDVLREWPDAHKGSVYCIDVLGVFDQSKPGSCLIASGSNDKSIRVYRADSGEISAPMKGHTGNIRCLRFWNDQTSSSNQKLLASVASGDLKPRVWDLVRGTSNPLSAHPSSIFACVWLSENYLATCCESGVVLIHNIKDVENVVYRHELQDKMAIYSAAFTAINDANSEGFLILGCSGGYVNVLFISFSFEGGFCVKGEHSISSRIHDDDVRSITGILSGDKVYFLCTSFDRTAAIWSFQVAEALRPSGTNPLLLSTLKSHGHTDKVLSGVFVDGVRSSVITSGADGKILFWPLCSSKYD